MTKMGHFKRESKFFHYFATFQLKGGCGDFCEIIIGGVQPGVTKCDAGEGVSKNGKKSVT